MAEVTMQRTWEFGRSNGQWTVNGKVVDVERCDARIKQGSAEIWTLRNGGGGWAHPIHIHFEEGQILERNRRPAAPYEKVRKDVYTLFPGDEVKIYMRFRDFLGRYPMHCHNVVHEDHAMMVRWDIVQGDPS
jgi:FtsP/CotA-like multicopper oxidase with cupredoxin domain